MPKRTIREMNAVCVDVVRRTHDTSTLYFFVGDDAEYYPGQFITIHPSQFPELDRWRQHLEKLKGKREGIRAYSMSSTPDEKCVSITVKAEEYDPEYNEFPPLLSPLLASGALKGRMVKIKGFSGHYHLSEGYEQETNEVFHICSGSGIVPNYGMLKDELKNNKNPNVKHTLLYVNKTHGDIIFREQLEALARAFPERFHLVHHITREEDPSVHGPNYKKGRPTVDDVRALIQNPETVRAFACGAAITPWDKKRAKAEGTEPRPKFMEFVEGAMKELGVKHFKKEAFG